jgi:oligosaccharide repeat unit polymerase
MASEQLLEKARVEPRRVPLVSGLEWFLAGAGLLISATAYLSTSYERLTQIVLAATLISGALVLVAGMQAFRTRVMGKFLLSAAVLGYFYLEALTTSVGEVPFEKPSFLMGPDPRFSMGAIRLGLLYLALFQLVLFVGYSIRPRFSRLLAAARRREDVVSVRSSVLRYLFAACAVIPLALSFDLDIGAARDSLIASRSGAVPGFSDIGLLSYLTFFGLFGASLLLVDGLLFRSFSRVQKSLLGLLVTLPFILGGARHLWIFVALPVFIVGVAKGTQRVSPSRAIRWVFVGAAILLIVQLQLVFRTQGWEKISDLRVGEVIQGDSTWQFDALLVANELVPNRHAYFLELAEPYFLIHWIPRALWPNKPVMESWFFYNDVYTQGSTSFNVTPSVIGQFHINFGAAGVIYIGILMGFLMVSADRLLARMNVARQRVLAVAIGSFYAFLVTSFRFYSPIYFTYFAFAFLAMLALSRSRRSIPHPRFAPLQPGVGRLRSGSTL